MTYPYRSNGRGFKRRKSKGGRSSSYGSERARQHVREAREFSRELGGLDEDVKQYFFSLPPDELEAVLSAYGDAYGEEKAEYARSTFVRWKSGATKMSGLVAKRLFAFLPPRMPIRTKFALAANVWRHFGPSSSHSLRVGPTTDQSLVIDEVSKRLAAIVTIYNTPDNVRRRFDWLAGGDVKVHEQLLNHFRQQEKSLAIEKIQLELPVLQRQVACHEGTTSRASSVLQINKHTISVFVDAAVGNQILDGPPPLGRLQSASPDKNADGKINWWTVLIVLFLLSALLRGFAR
jgi:hypothetical protein